MPRYQLSPAEKLSNVKQYGNAVPWELEDSTPVYTVSVETPDGVEVQLRRLRTYRHEHTDELRDFLSTETCSHFVFNDEWPSDEVIWASGIGYEPYIELCD